MQFYYLTGSTGWTGFGYVKTKIILSKLTKRKIILDLFDTIAHLQEPEGIR